MKDLPAVGGHHLSFNEIARYWSKVAGERSELLMEGLLKDFWLGKFESDGHSALFVLLPPDSPSVERQPGNFATRAGSIVVKVAEDGHSYPTHERKRFSILREDVAYVLCRPEWRGITAEHPAGFAQWTDERRDTERPNWRIEYEECYAALSTIPFNQWSPDMRDHYSQWRIERNHFAIWYRASPLSAGVDLKRFWPKAAQTPVFFPAAPATVKAKTECRVWLEGIMRESPQERTKTQDELFAKARTKFTGLSRRGFQEAWKEAAERVGAHAWVKGGAPKKSLR